MSRGRFAVVSTVTVTKSQRPRVNRLLLLNSMIGLFLGGLSARIFLISLPTVASGLGTDMLGVAWALIAYEVASIGLGVAIGRLGDIYSRRRIYAAGLFLMTLAAFLCGISQNVLQLALFRFLQGVAGSIIQSSGRALGLEAMPEGSEGKAQGLMVMSQQLGFLSGPPLGGFIIELFGWRWAFFLIVPIGALGVALASMAARKGEEAGGRAREPVDYAGAVMFLVLAVMATLLLDERTADRLGFANASLLGVAFLGGAWWFLRYEAGIAHPILDLSIFRNRVFSSGAAALLIVCMTQGLTNFIMPFYIQQVQGLSPSFMGVLFLIPSVCNLILAPVSGHVSDKIDARLPLVAGVSCFLAAFLVGANLAVDSHWHMSAALLALAGIAMAFFNAPVQAVMVAALPKGRWGVGTGVIRATFGLGHMLGISLTRLLLALAFRHYSGIAGAIPDPGHAKAFVSSINVAFAAATLTILGSLFASFSCGKPASRRAEPGPHREGRQTSV